MNAALCAEIFGTPAVAAEPSFWLSGSFPCHRNSLPTPGDSVSKKLVSNFEVHSDDLPAKAVMAYLLEGFLDLSTAWLSEVVGECGKMV